MPLYAFSSDSREFYKADIYRALSFPNGHVLHFRYKKKYVDEDFLDAPLALVDEKVVIVFTVTSGLIGHGSDVVDIPIRAAEVVHAEYSETTDVFHVYMRLEGFCTADMQKVPADQKPLKKFFSRSEVGYEEASWKSRIDEVSKHRSMPGTFFYIKGLYKSGKLVPVEVDNHLSSSFYELDHGENYVLSVSMANPEGVVSDIKLSYDENTVSANVVNPLVTSVQYDDIDIPVSVKSLQLKKHTTLLRFMPRSEGKELGQYFTNLELRLKLGVKQPIFFAGLTLLAFWGVVIGKEAPNVFWIIVSSLMIMLSAGMLFYNFNKK